MIDYGGGTNQYKVWDLTRKDIMISRDVVFIEGRPINQTQDTSRSNHRHVTGTTGRSQRTQDHSRLDHSLARTAKVRTSRPRDFITRIHDGRTGRCSNRWSTRRGVNVDTKVIGKVKQRDNHLQEIRGRRLRQKVRTDSHGKDCPKYGS